MCAYTFLIVDKKKKGIKLYDSRTGIAGVVRLSVLGRAKVNNTVHMYTVCPPLNNYLVSARSK